jgi:cell division protein FtsW
MNRGDRWLIVLPLVLTAIGLVMVYSSSAILGITRYQDPDYFLVKQLQRVILGVGAFTLVVWKANLRWLERHAVVLVAIAAFLLLALFVIGQASHGARRWIGLGPLGLQPTDLARLATVVFLAAWLKHRPPAELGFARGVGVPLVFTGVLAGLILIQPNLSSAGLLGATALGILFLAGARLPHLVLPIAGGMATAAIAVAMHPYMMKRVDTYVRFLLTGDLDTRGSGWQLDQSLIAIGSGGVFGRGLGAGLQKYLFLPEAHTDFIFSILAEELGFLGSTALFVLFVLLLWRGLRVAARASDPFHFLLAAGLTLQLGLYALVNLGVATGLVPTTGLPLPFVSYGGSALMVNLIAAGLLYRISIAVGSNEAVAHSRWGSP